MLNFCVNCLNPDFVTEIRDASPLALAMAFKMQAAEAASEADASAEEVEFNARAILSTIPHPNFAWSGLKLERAIEMVLPADRFAAAAAYCLGGGFSEVGDGAFDAAMMFCERLSGRRIDQLAAKYPELAPVLACHPNGDGVFLPDPVLDHEVRQFNSLFYRPSLGGRKQAERESPVYRLEL